MYAIPTAKWHNGWLPVCHCFAVELSNTGSQEKQTLKMRKHLHYCLIQGDLRSFPTAKKSERSSTSMQREWGLLLVSWIVTAWCQKGLRIWFNVQCGKYMKWFHFTSVRNKCEREGIKAGMEWTQLQCWTQSLNSDIQGSSNSSWEKRKHISPKRYPQGKENACCNSIWRTYQPTIWPLWVTTMNPIADSSVKKCITTTTESYAITP